MFVNKSGYVSDVNLLLELQIPEEKYEESLAVSHFLVIVVVVAFVVVVTVDNEGHV